MNYEQAAKYEQKTNACSCRFAPECPNAEMHLALYNGLRVRLHGILQTYVRVRPRA